MARPHNYVVQAAKKKPGAQLGNRHAARRTQEQVDNRTRIEALVRSFSTDVAAAIALVDRFCAEREMLAASLRETRP